MTIIKPNKKWARSTRMIIALLVMFSTMALGALFLYNSNVDLRHDITKFEKEIRKKEITNVELRAQLQEKLEFENVAAMAEKFSLILEKQPNYFREPKTTALQHN